MSAVPAVPVRALVQARMSSARFPGKVLAPLNGRPLIAYVLAAIEQIPSHPPVVVATSADESDDPLVRYLEHAGCTLFRGPLDDVFERFRACARAFPCDWILRLSADSPRLDPALLQRVIDAAADDLDIVTTIFPRRTFPRGQNAELIRTRALLAIDDRELTADDREHVTPYFYRHAPRFAIRSIESSEPQLGGESLAVDTVEDLRRLSEGAGG